MAQAVLANALLLRGTTRTDMAQIVVRYVCVTPSHVASAVPGEVGTLIEHSGTYGYCPGHAAGRHHWRNNIHVTLDRLVSGEVRFTLSR
jgi:hypothetical protein